MLKMIGDVISTRSRTMACWLEESPCRGDAPSGRRRRCVLQRSLQGAAQRRRQTEHRRLKGATRGGRRARVCGQGLTRKKVDPSQPPPGVQADLWAMVTHGQSAVARVRPSGLTGYRIVRPVQLWVANEWSLAKGRPPATCLTVGRSSSRIRPMPFRDIHGAALTSSSPR